MFPFLSSSFLVLLFNPFVPDRTSSVQVRLRFSQHSARHGLPSLPRLTRGAAESSSPLYLGCGYGGRRAVTAQGDHEEASGVKMGTQSGLFRFQTFSSV